MLFIASEKCLESSYWLWKSQRMKGPAWVKQKNWGRVVKTKKKKERGQSWVGLSLQISCTRMPYMSYLLALPNIVWPRRSLSKHRKDNRCHIVFLLCRVGPTTTDHHRVFQLTKPSLRRFSNFLIIWRMQSFPYVIPFIGFLWQFCRISWMWNSCAWLYNCKNLLLRHSFRIHTKWVWPKPIKYHYSRTIVFWPMRKSLHPLMAFRGPLSSWDVCSKLYGEL